LTYIFEAIFEVLLGVTGMLVLRLFGQRHREPSDTVSMVTGLVFWLVLGATGVLVARSQGWL